MLPSNFNEMIELVKKQKEKNVKVDELVNITKIITDSYDNLSSFSKNTISKLLPKLAEKIEELKNIKF